MPRRTARRLCQQKHTKCNRFLCEIHRELVDSFSSTDRRDTRADYFPKLFCCQGDLYRHYRQHRTDNRPFLVRSAPIFCLICLRTNEDADKYPRWRVFLVLRLDAEWNDDGAVQTADNLSEGPLDHSPLIQGHSAATKTRNIGRAVSALRPAYRSSAVRAVWVCIRRFGDYTDSP